MQFSLPVFLGMEMSLTVVYVLLGLAYEDLPTGQQSITWHSQWYVVSLKGILISWACSLAQFTPALIRVLLSFGCSLKQFSWMNTKCTQNGLHFRKEDDNLITSTNEVTPLQGFVFSFVY